MAGKPTKREIISTDELRQLVAQSGLPVAEIEKGVGMPKLTLEKSLAARPVNKNGYIRTMPEKWALATVKFIRERKVEIEEIKLEVKDVLIEHNVPIIEPKVIIPDEERKLEWIKKLQEAKAELN